MKVALSTLSRQLPAAVRIALDVAPGSARSAPGWLPPVTRPVTGFERPLAGHEDQAPAAYRLTVGRRRRGLAGADDVLSDMPAAYGRASRAPG